ncbi:MAG: hypothetical protein H0X26_00160 [Alphaproteobacteria bacterium]|nr:hypothetical protein [Alphaproteobacteria bacterium]
MINRSDIKKNILLILDSIKKSWYIEKKAIFDNFIVNNIVENRELTKELSLFTINQEKPSKYEIRFFWPSHFSPEVYDVYGLMFDKRDYKHDVTHDKYIVNNNNINIKVRENELHIKKYIQQIGNVYQFKKKKKIGFPLKGKKLSDLLSPTVTFDSDILETSEDLVKKFSHLPTAILVDVFKERYIRKMEDHTKIEFSLIELRGKQWKTICIESKNIQKVLALSLLVNPKNAERLSYNEFLCKYAHNAAKQNKSFAAPDIRSTSRDKKDGK